MSQRRKQVRGQIRERLAQQVISIEQRIADALNMEGKFHANIDSAELGLILQKVVYVLVGEQKVANLDVPILHNVTQMDVQIVECEAHIVCKVHIHQPIIAFIDFIYTLENDPRSQGTLRLKNNRIQVGETTRPFDFAAKLALKMLRVEHIARTELSDPNGIIKRMLPAQLVTQGFEGVLDTIDLEFNGDNTLRVLITAEPQAVGYETPQ